MIARSRRLASAHWFGLPAGVACAVLLGAGSCGQRSLIEVNVVGDAPFQSVTLRLAAGGASKDFTGVSLSADTPYKAGLYVPDSASGSLTVVASALDGAGHCIGDGQARATGVSAGAVAGPVTLTVSHTSACTVAGSGTGGSGATGTGGGNETGGTSGGTGGTTGTGGSGAGGSGGTTGTGGQTAVNIIVNGDFSNGETGWGIKAGTGTVTTASGAYCVAVPAGNVSLTIGYPDGATPAFQINTGVSYRFSYQASASTGAVALEARVGQTMSPYDATGADWMNEPVGATLQTFTHTFTRATTDSSMGIAFNLTGGPGTACFDNVSLTLN